MRETTPETAHNAEYDLLQIGAGVLISPCASLIELRGEDRLDWLQGQATNDLRNLQLGGMVQFCLTEPTGQMLAACTVWSLPGRYLISTDSKTKEAVLKRVEQMVILEDIEAKDLDLELQLFSIQGPEATERLTKMLTLPSMDGGPSRFFAEEVFVLRSDRTGRGGWDIWGSPNVGKHVRELFQPIGDETLNIARIEAGIPFFDVDMGAKTLPPEMGPAFATSHVSYNKGCYTGQEVLMRIHSRGHTNKTWMGLALSRPVKASESVTLKNTSVGEITSAANSPTFGPIAAAMLRNEAATPGTVVSIGEAKGEVMELPFLRD